MKLRDIKGIGPKTELELNKNNIYTLNDLLYLFPKSYNIYELRPDLLFEGQYTTIEAIITNTPYFIKYRKNVNAIVFTALINNQKVKCIYFSSDYLRYKLFKNTKVMLYGKYKSEASEFHVKKMFFNDFISKVDCDYKIDNITNAILRKAVKALFDNNIYIGETLPMELLDKYKLLDINKYIYLSHFPSNSDDVKQVYRRRKYEEFFWYAIRMDLLRNTRYLDLKAPKIINDNEINRFISSLSFKLTEDQLNTIESIKNDLKANYTMNRLVQGDVGCGKSIVSIISALMAVNSGYQAAIMVPTEILANQQYKLASELLNDFNCNVALLTSSTKKSDKEDILYKLNNNKISILIGTHSLLEDKVIFNKLGLVIIDEQHRFGVKQRAKLIEKFPHVDALYLTATPIPRSLGLTMFGDLDISSIKTMPAGRKSVITKIIHKNNISGLLKSIENHIAQREQAYVVVPLVNENELIDRVDIQEAHDLIKDNVKNAKIGIVYGKMTPKEKNAVMDEFYKGHINVLISTTVIEVGVNVKNATIMTIFNAECFGLAQLHQLRGRVGRSDLQAFCALVCSDTNNPRLKALESTTDGFEIAEADFRLRGPGDYLGNAQSGYAPLEYADFDADLRIWECAKNDAGIYIKKFLKKEIQNPIFDGIVIENKTQKRKIN